MPNVDYTFIARRRAKIFAEINHKLGPIAAGIWTSQHVPSKERKELSKYLEKELRKYEPFTH